MTADSGTLVVVATTGVLAETTGIGFVVVLVDVERGGADVVGAALVEPITESSVEG